MEVKNPIEEEIIKATGFKVKSSENRSDHLYRLGEAADTLGDDEFDRLSKKAQDWCNAAAKAISEDEDVAEFKKPRRQKEAEESEEKPRSSRSKKAEKGDEEADDEEDENPEDDEDEGKEQEEDEKKEKPRSGRTKRSERAAKEDKEEKTDKRKAKARGTGIHGNKLVQDVLVHNPRASVDEIVKELERKGHSVPSRMSISTSRGAFRSALETLNRHDKLKEPAQL